MAKPFIYILTRPLFSSSKYEEFLFPSGTPGAPMEEKEKKKMHIFFYSFLVENNEDC